MPIRVARLAPLRATLRPVDSPSFAECFPCWSGIRHQASSPRVRPPHMPAVFPSFTLPETALGCDGVPDQAVRVSAVIQDRKLSLPLVIGPAMISGSS